MLRLAAVALIAALSGCLASTSVPLEVPVADDGLTVTATRVEALVHEVDARGRIESQLCDPGSSPCPGSFDWPRPTFDFADPLALFWRLDVGVAWSSMGPQEGVQLTVYATKPCGIACVRERFVATADDVEAPELRNLDVYLRPGETGVRLRLEPRGSMETGWGDAGITYHITGIVGGYRAVAEPIVIH